MNYENKPSGYYDNIRTEMLAYLPEDAKTIIDIGCGNGCFAEVLKEKTGAETWGMEYVEEQAALAAKVLHKVFSGRCEDHLDELPDDYFDVIYCNDVLEHLNDPYEVIRKLRNKLTANGVLISSIPSIRYHNALMRLLFKKDFRYEPFGVMDFTHLRFFTSKSIKRMFTDAGYTISLHEGINRSRSLKPILYNIPLLFSQTDIFYPQFATVARK